MSDGGIAGEWGEFSRQVASSLLELERRLETMERRVARLDTHSAELARELLDVIGRLDTLEARLEAVDASYVRHQGQNEGDFRRVEQSVDRVGQDLSAHEWREHRR